MQVDNRVAVVVLAIDQDAFDGVRRVARVQQHVEQRRVVEEVRELLGIQRRGGHQSFFVEN